MKHIILFPHGGSGNHGCEAIVRTTVNLIGNKNNAFSLLSYDPQADNEYGIGEICDIYSVYGEKKAKRKSLKWLSAFARSSLTGKDYYLTDLPRLNAINAKRGDIALSIGGDNYCYDFTNELMDLNSFWRRNGIKTVLWGASVEPELLNEPNVVNDLAAFDLITAREKISYEAIKDINKNTVLVSDPAFVLDAEEVSLPEPFCNSTFVGINLSPMAEELEPKHGLARKNFERLIEYILDKTNYSIMLIPHVVINNNDDRIINGFLYDKYKYSNRIMMVEDSNCKVLKGYISKCSFFIGARTHATIAAYSSLIPTLVLGYSVKSIGIARDIFGTDKDFVVPVQSLLTEDDLKNAFIWIKENEIAIRERLISFIPQYKKRVYNGVKRLNEIL